MAKKTRVKLIDAARLAELEGKLENFRAEEKLSTGEFEFLLETFLKILDTFHDELAGDEATKNKIANTKDGKKALSAFMKQMKADEAVGKRGVS